MLLRTAIRSFFLVLALSSPALSATRAVSLRVLSDELAHCRIGHDCPPEVERLGGLETASGFVLDRETGDVVVYGDVDTGRAPLWTEDLLVALRNAFRLYVARDGARRVWSPLGCSIDPEPRVLTQLRQAIAMPSFDAALARWKDVCVQSERVVVTGMPHDTRLARVLVTADYDLKRIVNGSDSLALPGFESLSDMTLQAIRAGASRSTSLLTRFWFTIGHARLAVDDDAVELTELEVRLMTEEQLLGARGHLIGTHRPGILAETFASRFNEHWREIATRRPIYGEMDEIFRVAVLARAIAEEHTFAQIGFVPDVLLDTAVVPPRPVEHALPGQSHVVGFDRDGSATSPRTSVRLPSCGGVDLDVDLARAEIHRGRSAALENLVSRILQARPSFAALVWSVIGGPEA